MKFFLCLFIFILGGLHAVELKEASADEASLILQRLCDLYSHQLVDYGLFDDNSKAKQAATDEVTADAANYHYFIVLNENMDSGYLIYTLNPPNAWIEVIYIEPNLRGKGIGNKTLELVENQLKIQGIQRISLYVFDKNQSALQLYLSRGYCIEKSVKGENTVIGHFMFKNLTQFP